MENLEEFEPIIQAEARKHQIAGLDWQDIAQEIRIRLWKKRDLFDSTKSSYKTWANRVMRNCIYDLIRLSKTKKAAYLNEAISMDDLKEKGLEIDEDGNIFKLKETSE